MSVTPASSDAWMVARERSRSGRPSIDMGMPPRPIAETVRLPMVRVFMPSPYPRRRKRCAALLPGPPSGTPGARARGRRAVAAWTSRGPRAACAARMPITARRVVQLAARAPRRGPRRASTQRSRHAELLAVAGVPVAVRHVGQVAGQEDPQRLVDPAGRGRSSPCRTSQRPASRSASSCSSRAAACHGGSPATSSRPAGQLPLEGADRVAVLLDQQHPVTVVQRHDRHGAGVLDVLAA